VKRFGVLALAVLLAAGCGTKEPPAAPAAGKKLTVGLMPKLTGISFFNAAQKGGAEAAKELGVEYVYDGPAAGSDTIEKQSQLVETWVARKFDAIAVAPNDPQAIAPALTKARARGIKVIAWDSDAKKEARDLFVTQCTPQSIAKALMDTMAAAIGPNGKYIIITGTLTAANQNIWMAEMEKYRQAKYPGMKNLSPTPVAPGEDQAKATQMAIDALKTYPDVQGIFAITSVALPGAAEALRKTNSASKVFLTGLATPNDMREYVKDGTVKKFVLWSPVDLGYLAVQVATAVTRGTLKPGATDFPAGRLGKVKVVGDQVILGDPIVFDKSNIDKYDF
jgi:rhamnose transport system substrate-binding protein